MTTDTPRTDAASFSSRDPLELMKTSRQLERELNDLWSRFDKQMEAEAEVARLRELLERAIENCECNSTCGSHVGDYCGCGRYARNEQIRDELARLAPAPEETQDGATMDVWYGGFSKVESTEAIPDRIKSLAADVLKLHRPDEEDIWEKHGLSEPPEPAPEWREFTGTKEKIQLGDEERNSDREMWYRAGGVSVGSPACQYPNYRFRTTRPAPPVVDQPQSITK